MIIDLGDGESWNTHTDEMGVSGDTEPNMSEAEQIVNAAAEFWPMKDGGEMQRPCLVIGGIEINAYFEGGKLRISVEIGDDADPQFVNGSTLPYEFSVNGATIWEA